MKAEERAKQVWDSLEGPLLAEGDAIEATAKAIREAEQQARKEALEEAANHIAVPWPRNGTEFASAIRELIERDGGTQAKEYGCHCDLEPHMKPDGCVFDEGRPQDCSMTRLITRKEECKYWKPIDREGGE